MEWLLSGFAATHFSAHPPSGASVHLCLQGGRVLTMPLPQLLLHIFQAHTLILKQCNKVVE